MNYEMNISDYNGICKQMDIQDHQIHQITPYSTQSYNTFTSHPQLVICNFVQMHVFIRCWISCIKYLYCLSYTMLDYGENAVVIHFVSLNYGFLEGLQKKEKVLPEHCFEVS